MPTTAPTFELQSHSTYSDGELPPAEVVAAAVDAGVELLALSDHDSVEGVAEAQDAAAAAGLPFVTAVEISSLDPISQDLHILGYTIDIDSAEQFEPAIERALSRPPELMQAIKTFGDAIHPYHDGHSSERVLDAIDAFVAAGGRNRKSKPLNFWRKLKLRRPRERASKTRNTALT